MDTLDTNLIEGTRSELAVCTRRTPEVVALASVASLARSVEPELLRALRVGLGARISGTRLSVSAESALWFSNFVESRGTEAITLRPEVLYVLRPELASDGQLLEDARAIVEDCHKSAPDVLQWEERIVYLALTGQTALLEEEIWRGLRSVSQGTRQPLVNWISDMWLRLPPEATSNPVLEKLYQYNTGLLRRKSQTASGGDSSATDLLLDFSSFPTRELGVVLRDGRFIIGDVPEAEFGIEVPDLDPVELDVAFGSSNEWVEQRKVERGQVAEIVIRNGDTIRVRTLAGQIHELSPAVFLPPAKRFAVALSFAGEARDFVEKVAEELAAKVGKERVLYDKFHLAELARTDLGPYLLNLYQAESELIVVFLHGAPTAQDWSGLDWHQIAVLFEGNVEDQMMILSFGPPTFLTPPELMGGYVDISELSPQKVAEIISERLRLASSDHGKKFVPADISRILKYEPAELIGREEELGILSDAWARAVRGETNRPHVLSIVGLGGEGKSSLVAKWLIDQRQLGWPGCDAVFAWSFYEDYDESTDDEVGVFLKEALVFFGDTEMANSTASAVKKADRLAQLVGERRTLLILDGLDETEGEPVELTNQSGFRNVDIAELLIELDEHNQGLCIVTAPSLQMLGKNQRHIALFGLSTAAGVHLLRTLGLKGPDKEFERLVKDVEGHPLTLNLFGSYLRDFHDGHIDKRGRLHLPLKAFALRDNNLRKFASYLEWLGREGEEGKQAVDILRLLALFDRPAPFHYLSALLKGEPIKELTESLVSLSEQQLHRLLKRLERASLLIVDPNPSSGDIMSVDAPPLLREYIGDRLRDDQADAWRAANERLYQHLTKTTAEGSEPTLEDLQPLAQAVRSGCEAGLHQKAFDEVYIKRMQRGSEGYVWRKLGAFGFDLGVIANFFEEHWLALSPALSQMAQPFLLHNAALDLRALGRLTEALDPMRTALGIQINQNDWKNAATSAGNLSELELTLGDTSGAVRDAEQAMSFADRSDDDFQLVARRENLADAYHQSGKLSQAEKLFFDAEQLQARRQPNNPLLYSVGGFCYCDLLLGQSERAAWRAKLHLKPRQSDFESLAAKCEAVIERTSQTLRWIAEYGRDLLSPALDRLSLTRAAVYLTILGDRRREARTEIDAAVDGLRRAGQQQYLPSVLFTRALAQTLTGESGVARDLDEAWETAERGPMRLHMADIHLYRARLFHAVKPYPWDKNPDGSSRGPKDDLAAARKLIEQCGYWRRKEELEDAEEAAKSWD